MSDQNSVFEKLNPDLKLYDHANSKEGETNVSGVNMSDENSVFEESNPFLKLIDNSNSERETKGCDMYDQNSVFEESNPELRLHDNAKSEERETKGGDMFFQNSVFEESYYDLKLYDNVNTEDGETYGGNMSEQHSVFEELNSDFKLYDNMKLEEAETNGGHMSGPHSVFGELNPDLKLYDYMISDEETKGIDMSEQNSVFVETNPYLKLYDNVKSEEGEINGNFGGSEVYYGSTFLAGDMSDQNSDFEDSNPDLKLYNNAKSEGEIKGIFTYILETQVKKRELIDVVQLKRNKYQVYANYALRAILQERYYTALTIYDLLIKLLTNYDDFDEYDICEMEFDTLKIMYHFCCIHHHFEIEKCIDYFESILEKYETKLPIVLCQLVRCYSLNKKYLNRKLVNTFLYKLKHDFETMLLNWTEISYPGVEGFLVPENHINYMVLFVTGYESVFNGAHKSIHFDCRDAEVQTNINRFRNECVMECCPGNIVHRLIRNNQIAFSVGYITTYTKKHILNWEKAVYFNEPLVTKDIDCSPLLEVCRKYIRINSVLTNTQTSCITHTDYCGMYEHKFVCKNNNQIVAPSRLKQKVDTRKTDNLNSYLAQYKSEMVESLSKLSLSHKEWKTMKKNNNLMKKKICDMSKNIIPDNILEELVTKFNTNLTNTTNVEKSLKMFGDTAVQKLSKSKQVNKISCTNDNGDKNKICDEIYDMVLNNVHTSDMVLNSVNTSDTQPELLDNENQNKESIVETLRKKINSNNTQIEDLKSSNLENKKIIEQLELKLKESTNLRLQEEKKREFDEEVTKFDKLNVKYNKLKADHGTILKEIVDFKDSSLKLEERIEVLQQINKDITEKIQDDSNKISKIYSIFAITCKNSNVTKISDKYEEIENYFLQLEINNNERSIHNELYETCSSTDNILETVYETCISTENSSETYELPKLEIDKENESNNIPQQDNQEQIIVYDTESQCDAHNDVIQDVCPANPPVAKLTQLMDVNIDKSIIDSAFRDKIAKENKFKVVRHKKWPKSVSEPKRKEIVNTYEARYPTRTTKTTLPTGNLKWTSRNSDNSSASTSSASNNKKESPKKCNAKPKMTKTNGNHLFNLNSLRENGEQIHEERRNSHLLQIDNAWENINEANQAHAASMPNSSQVNSENGEGANIGNVVKSECPAATQQFMALVTRIHVDMPTCKKYNIFQGLKLVRERNNNSLSFLTYSEILKRVQEALKVPRTTSWAVIPNPKLEWQHNQDGERICTICLDEMTHSKVTSLECEHRFHTICLRPWIKVNSICPICRKAAFMDEDYPPLMQP